MFIVTYCHVFGWMYVHIPTFGGSIYVVLGLDYPMTSHLSNIKHYSTPPFYGPTYLPSFSKPCFMPGVRCGLYNHDLPMNHHGTSWNAHECPINHHIFPLISYESPYIPIVFPFITIYFHRFPMNHHIFPFISHESPYNPMIFPLISTISPYIPMIFDHSSPSIPMEISSSGGSGCGEAWIFTVLVILLDPMLGPDLSWVESHDELDSLNRIHMDSLESWDYTHRSWIISQWIIMIIPIPSILRIMIIIDTWCTSIAWIILWNIIWFNPIPSIYTKKHPHYAWSQ